MADGEKKDEKKPEDTGKPDNAGKPDAETQGGDNEDPSPGGGPGSGRIDD